MTASFPLDQEPHWLFPTQQSTLTSRWWLWRQQYGFSHILHRSKRLRQISPPHTSDQWTVILTVCTPDHLLWCVTGKGAFGFHPTSTKNTSGEAWVDHHLHACFLKTGPTVFTLHPTKTRVNQQAIIKRRSDGWWHTYKRVCFIHLKGALPLRATGRWRK